MEIHFDFPLRGPGLLGYQLLFTHVTKLAPFEMEISTKCGGLLFYQEKY